MANYSAELDFLIRFFKHISIPVNIVAFDNDTSIFESLNLGPHKYVYSEMQLMNYLKIAKDTITPNALHRFNNTLLCHYYVFMLGSANSDVCIIGPYLTGPIVQEDIDNMLIKANLSSDNIDILKEYYRHITIVECDSYILSLLNTFGETLWGGYSNFMLKDVADHLIVTQDNEYEKDNSTEEDRDNETDSSLIRMRGLQERYQLENELMEAVSKGEVHRSEMVFQSFLSIQAGEVRTADSVRNMKNYTIVLNTLLRKAAEAGKVHPIHLDKISSQIARKIEECKSVADVNSLGKEMIRKYALLVRNHSMSNYSSLIQQALMIINIDLSAELTLNPIAEKLHVNASYLSSQFKKELGVTLTDYITQKRINHAIFLINSSNLSISTIAQQCGIPDVQYFSKIFKKQLGMSPLQYKKMIQGK